MLAFRKTQETSQSQQDAAPTTTRTLFVTSKPNTAHSTTEAASTERSDTATTETVTSTKTGTSSPTRLAVPAGKKLFRYQIEGVKQLLQRSRSLLADEMGLGKTPQAIVYANMICPNKVVVIAPASALGNWQEEWEAWSTLSHNVLVITSGRKAVPQNINTLILSYDLAKTPKWKDFLKRFLTQDSPSLLICDEAHYLSKWTSQRTRSIIIDIGSQVKNGLLITGSPMRKHIPDLHPLFSFCEPFKWGKFRDFCYRFSYPCPGFGDAIEFRGVRNLKELRSGASRFMIRRFKKDVQNQIPPKRLMNVYLTVTSKAGETLQDQSKTIITAINDNRADSLRQTHSSSDSSDSSTNSESFASLRKQLGLDKLPAVCEWLSNLLDASSSSQRFVIFAYHRDVIRALHQFLAEKGRSVSVITGETPLAKRQAEIKRFQAGETTIFLGNMLAAGVAINLQCASTCVFTEIDWTPAVISQAIDRLHRTGQVNPVDIYFLLAKNTIDDDVIEVVRSKMVVISKVLGRRVTKADKEKSSGTRA